MKIHLPLGLNLLCKSSIIWNVVDKIIGLDIYEYAWLFFLHHTLGTCLPSRPWQNVINNQRLVDDKKLFLMSENIVSFIVLSRNHSSIKASQNAAQNLSMSYYTVVVVNYFQIISLLGDWPWLPIKDKSVRRKMRRDHKKILFVTNNHD